jgi:hypothetical protein
MISPGSLPKKGMPLFLNRSNKAPRATMSIPKRINSFAICCNGSDIKNLTDGTR